MPKFNKDVTELIHFLNKKLKPLTETLNNFKAGIGNEDWALSMERSHYAFEAAARHSVFTEVVRAFTDKNSKTTIESLHEHVKHEVQRYALQPRHSSSPTMNLMHQETLAAWAELFEYLEMR